MASAYPTEIKRREDRLTAIATAKAKIEARAKARDDQAQAEHEDKRVARAKKEAATGKKPGGKPPPAHQRVIVPFVNDRKARPDDALRDGDHVYLAMPVGGG